MLMTVFNGHNYSYAYEPETGHYVLHDNEHTSHACLQGEDARIFREQLERIDELPDPENKARLLTEDAISVYL
jgi:hypothetical protein